MIKVFMVVRWPVGGIRTFINYVYSQWGDSSLELHFLTPNLPEVSALKEQLKHVSCVWHATSSDDPDFKEFFAASQKIMSANKFDLIHAHGFTSAFSVALRLPFLRAKAIFTSHDVLNASQFSGLVGQVKKVIFACLINRFNVIHSVSHAAQKNLLEMLPLISKNKTQVILNGVDTERFFSAEPFALKKALNIEPEVKIIGFFGRFMSQKGFKYLVEAVAKLESNYPGQYRVVCFGNNGGFIREEKAALEKRGLLHLFYFHGFVADTAPYVKGCDIVAMPSLWEACGLVAMEVLSAGVPLIATNCGGLAEVCANTPAIMVEPANSDQLYDSFVSVNEIAKRRFVDFAPAAKDRFNIHSTKVSFRTLYNNLTNNQSPNR
jgi:glycosyltransferase involved in cell wall biosynthesis